MKNMKKWGFSLNRLVREKAEFERDEIEIICRYERACRIENAQIRLRSHRMLRKTHTLPVTNYGHCG
jgi:hypothetical protein